MKKIVVLLMGSIFVAACSAPEKKREEISILSPDELYGQLFFDVQSRSTIFPDSKTFVDCVPLRNVNSIVNDYSALKDKSDAALLDFIKENFKIPERTSEYISDSLPINEHIAKLWDILSRKADDSISGTLIPLPNSYVVPGGRFREVYYWDSYFTMLGLEADGKIEKIENIIDNFSFLLNEYGFIPNGNRTYYLGRSQPPFYACMVSLLADATSDEVLVKYLPYLEMEYDFWMDGADQLNEEQPTHRRVVRLSEGEILNRYWDDNDTPRPESYREDVKTAEKAIQLFPMLTKDKVYRNLRAGAESGWDFSSRWLSADEDGNFQLSTIHTTDIIPVDLNSLLYNLEKTISKAYALKGNSDKQSAYSEKAESRKKLVMKYCWNADAGYFMDYNFADGKQAEILSLAGMYPLFFEIADVDQATQAAARIANSFLMPGGVVSTVYNTGEQWDAPNGWAPLQWMTIQGLRNYNFNVLATEIKNRWLAVNDKVYVSTYKLVEKYDVTDLSLQAGGGEYPTQDGFGWTNGVYQKLSKENK